MKYFDPIGLKKIEDTHPHTHTHIYMHVTWQMTHGQYTTKDGRIKVQQHGNFFLKAVDDTVGKMGWWLHEGLSENLAFHSIWWGYKICWIPTCTMISNREFGTEYTIRI